MPRVLSEVVRTSFSGQALTYFQKAADFENSTRLRVVLASNVNHGLISGELQVADVNRDRVGTYALREHDVVVAPSRSRLRAAVVAADYAGSLIGSNLVVLREVDGATPHYVAAVLNHHRFGRQFDSAGRGSTVSLSELRRMIIPTHTAVQQTEIGALYALSVETLAAALEEYDWQQELVEEFISYGDGRD